MQFIHCQPRTIMDPCALPFLARPGATLPAAPVHNTVLRSTRANHAVSAPATMYTSVPAVRTITRPTGVMVKGRKMGQPRPPITNKSSVPSPVSGAMERGSKSGQPHQPNRNKNSTCMPTPVSPPILSQLLQGYDPGLSRYLVQGFSKGFTPCCRARVRRSTRRCWRPSLMRAWRSASTPTQPPWSRTSRWRPCRL